MVHVQRGFNFGVGIFTPLKATRYCSPVVLYIMENPVQGGSLLLNVGTLTIQWKHCCQETFLYMP